MAKIRNMAGSFIIMGALISLLLTAWGGGFVENYSINETDKDETDKNIFQRLKNLDLLQGVNKLETSIHRLTTISNPVDLLGGLAIGATGTLQIIGGIITFPVDIFAVITDFYPNGIPDAVSILIGSLVILSVGFILLSAKLRYEI